MMKEDGEHFKKLGIHLFMAADVTPPGVLRQGTDVTMRLLAPFGELLLIEEISP